MQFKLINRLTPQILNQVTNLHLNILQESFLNNFGKNFLEIIYKTILESKNNIIILTYHNNRIIAFLVATKNNKLFKKETLNKNLLKLAKKLLPTFLQKPKLIFIVLTWLLNKKIDNNLAELQFLAVDKGYQGKGIGIKMINLLNKQLLENGINKYIVSTKKQDFLSNKFYKKLGFKFMHTREVFGDELNFYLSPIIRRAW